RLLISFQRACLRSRCRGRLVLERLRLSAASRSFRQSTAPLVLSGLQDADPLASESAPDQLARSARPLRKLRPPTRIPIFCGGIDHRSSLSCDLAMLLLANGDCSLDFGFTAHCWYLYRLLALS